MKKQKDEQRLDVQASSSSDSTNAVAFAVKSNDPKRTGDRGNYNSHSRNYSSNSGTYKGQKKDRPFYTHSQYHGHTVDK